MSKYEPYKPTKWEQRIDSMFGLASPRAALNRMVDREKANWFRYLAAQPSSARTNSGTTTAGEWLKVQREKMQVMWNAITMVDNSGLCSGILMKFPTYICGTLRWQARTGDKNVNTQYQQYIAQKTGKPGNIDVTRRHTLRQQCILDIKSIALKGDVGTNIVREDDGEIYLQGIEADRIGDPYRWTTSERYVRGLELDEVGAITGVRVYHQEKRSGLYKYDDTFPTRDPKTGLPTFLFFTNPIDFDNYRGVSLFKHAIDNSTYIDRMREYELQALLWASSQSGVYYTKSGGLPEQLPFNRTPLIDTQGNTIDTFQTRPNTLVALSADGERVEMFQHDRPSPNVIGMYENTVRDICNGAGITESFGYNMAGLTGPAVRMASAQDARAIQIWQEMLREQKLDQVIMLLLGNAIASGELQYHPNWLQWDWFFPAKPTIDVGRESQANIEEIEAGINTGANVASEGGLGDIQDVITQRSHEVEMMIDAAMEVAKAKNLPWEQVYALMIPPPKQTGQGGGAGVMGAAGKAAGIVDRGMNRDKPGATDDGVEIDGGNGSGKGGSSRFRMHDDGSITIFYRPDQARGEPGTPEGGQFVPEGGGAGGGGNGGGAAVATQKKTEIAPKKAESGGGKATEGKPKAGLIKPKTDDEAIDALYSPADAERYKELKKQWSTVNNSLLSQIDTPDSPEAQAGLKQLQSIVKQMHQLHADPGGIPGIGLPGGPKDIIVVGSGPGGLGAAINAGTDGLDTAFIDTQPIVGGQSKYSSRVENYPGFPIGVSGEKLAKNMYDQATRLGAESKLETQVTGLDYDPKSGLKTVHLSDGTSMTGRTVVIAGGVQFRHIGDFPGSDAKTIVYGDAKTLGQMAEGKSVVVIGGSNGAAQAALGVAPHADHVYVLSRTSIGSSMSDYQVEALQAHPKITIIENDQIASLDKDEKGNSRLLHTAHGKALPADAVGIFAGSAPDTKWLPENVARSEDRRDRGKIKVDSEFQVVDGSGKVAIPGVYAVGDIRSGSVQRILASAAEGQMAERNIAVQFAKELGIAPTTKARDVSISRAKKKEVSQET